MAKLTARQKENILAKWNTGFYTKTELARKYKVNEKTIRNIIGNKPPKHKELTEINMMIEATKKAEISPIERQAIDRATEEKIKTLELDNELILNNRKIAKLLQKRIVENKDNISLKNVKQVSSTILDIEKIATGQSKKDDIDNVSIPEITITRIGK